MDGKARANFFRKWVKEDGTLDFEGMYPMLVIDSCYDPETGERIFSPEDKEALLTKSGAALESIAQTAMALSAIGPGKVDEAGKGSGSTETKGSSSKKPTSMASPSTSS